MNIKSRVSIMQDIDITINDPAFYKLTEYGITEYLAVFETYVIKIWDNPQGRVYIENRIIEDAAELIIKAHSLWEQVSEDEFVLALENSLNHFNYEKQTY